MRPEDREPVHPADVLADIRDEGADRRRAVSRQEPERSGRSSAWWCSPPASGRTAPSGRAGLRRTLPPGSRGSPADRSVARSLRSRCRRGMAPARHDRRGRSACARNGGSVAGPARRPLPARLDRHRSASAGTAARARPPGGRRLALRSDRTAPIRCHVPAAQDGRRPTSRRCPAPPDGPVRSRRSTESRRSRPRRRRLRSKPGRLQTWRRKCASRVGSTPSATWSSRSRPATASRSS